MTKYLLTLLAMLPFSAQAWEYPEFTQELPYEEGMGTQEIPYVIKNAQQLANLAYYVNNGTSFAGQYFKLGNDIDLNPGFTFNPDDENSYAGAKRWIPIGATKTFKGNFDGDGHSVKGLLFMGDNINSSKTIYEGLFGYVEDMTLSNLEISNSLMSYDLEKTDLYGLTCGFFAISSMNCNFIGLTNRGNVRLNIDDSSFYKISIAGIVSEVNVYGSMKEIWTTINNCSNYGSMRILGSDRDESMLITIDQGFGGIVVSGGRMDMYDCHNYGDIDSKGILNCAGIGINVGGYDIHKVTEYRNISNSGSIRLGAGLFVMGGGVILKDSYNDGDIVNGCGLMNDCQFMKMENCYNSGSIDDELGRGVNGTGGLIGYSDYLGEMTGCHNIGSVSSNQSSGGLIGCAGPYDILISECYNEGEIISKTNSAGGIVGTVYESGLTLEGCWNNASIWGEEGCGGLIGYGGVVTINEGENSGKISGGSMVGGIIGHASELSMINTSNIGDVAAESDKSGFSYAGGLIGNSANGFEMRVVENCHNSGNVSATGKYVGGIAGYTGSISRCYNSGNIEGGSHVGGLTGTTSAYSVGVGISNCYNVGNVKGQNFVGGLCANLMGTVENSFNYGELECESGNKALLCIFGYETSDNVNSKACFALPQDGWDIALDRTLTQVSSGAKICSEKEFKSGSICILLNGDQEPTPWGQTVGEDPYPLLNGAGNPDNVDTGVTMLPEEILPDLWTVSRLNGEIVKQMESETISGLLQDLPSGIYILSSRKNGSFKILCR